jgi:transcriptional activator SPT7
MAYAMRNLCNSLANLVPDITIKTRAEAEAEERAMEEEETHSDDESKPGKLGRKAGGGYTSKKGHNQKKGGGRSAAEETHVPENRLLNGVREGSMPVSLDGRAQSMVNGSTPPPHGGTPGVEGLDPTQVVEQAREDRGDDFDEGDVLSREWTSSTQKARAKYALQRHKLLRKGFSEEEHALTRTKRGMNRFKEWEEKVDDVVRFKEPEPEPDPENEDVLEEEDAEEEDFLAEYDPAAGMLPNLNSLDDEEIKMMYARLPRQEYRPNLYG